MVETKKDVRFTIVAFIYNKKNSIYYSNFKSPKNIADMVEKCLRIGADVISIRRIYTENPVKKCK